MSELSIKTALLSVLVVAEDLKVQQDSANKPKLPVLYCLSLHCVPSLHQSRIPPPPGPRHDRVKTLQVNSSIL